MWGIVFGELGVWMRSWDREKGGGKGRRKGGGRSRGIRGGGKLRKKKKG
jgi:hypothetical protein